MASDVENFVKWIKANGLTPIISTHSDDLDCLTHPYLK